MSTRRSEGTKTPAPVVFVPGFGHAERGWDLLRRHLHRIGFADVSTVPEAAGRGDIPHRAERLARHVEARRSLTGADRVHVVGHNVGGVIARYFVQLLDGDQVVDTVVSVGTPHAGSKLTPVGLGPAAAQLRPGSTVLRHLDESTRPLATRWVSYFAEQDLFVQPATSAMVKHPLLKATNILVADLGHLSLTLPTAVCRSVAHQLAAAEGVPGFGAPVSAVPGSVLHLDQTEALRPSAAAMAASRAAHPSNYRWSRERRLQLAEPAPAEAR